MQRLWELGRRLHACQVDGGAEDPCLHKGLPCHGGPDELPEGHQEVPAADAAQVEERVRPGSQQKDAPEAVPASAVKRSAT